jgi:hypothetical protein
MTDLGGSVQAPIQRLRAGHYVTPEGIEIVRIPSGAEDSGCWLVRYGDENYRSDRYERLGDARFDAWLDPWDKGEGDDRSAGAMGVTDA